MNREIASYIVGVIFGLGLCISGMINPAKVLNFLDLFGAWDPSLAFVMLGAIATTFVGYRLFHFGAAPTHENRYRIPDRNDIDANLLIGAGLFGVGWGLAGYCPGPALTGLTTFKFETFVFVAAMFAGMWAYKKWAGRGQTIDAPPEATAS